MEIKTILNNMLSTFGFAWVLLFASLADFFYTIHIRLIIYLLFGVFFVFKVTKTILNSIKLNFDLL